MNNLKSRISALAWGALCLLAAGSAARADDTEIFFGNTTVSTPANIMLILDTSGSMAGHVSGQAAYNPATTYTGSCSDSYYYYVANPGSGTVTPPDCSNASTRITKSQFKCTAAAAALGTGSGAAGYYADTRGGLIRWGNYTTTTNTNVLDARYTTRTTCQNARESWISGQCYRTVTTTNTTHTWQSSLAVTNGTDIECAADQPTVGSDTTYPTKNADATSTTGVYSSATTDNWWQYGTGRPGGSYLVYSANYLNYYVWAPSSIQTRMSTVKTAATGLLSLLSGVNVGLMTYSYDGSGGMVRDPVQSIDATGVRDSMISEIDSMVPAGDTPLSETLFEAYRYFAGGPVLFGGTGSNGTFASSRCTSATPYDAGGGVYIGSCNASASFPSVASSQSPAGTYNSPSDYSCQKNYIVYLTDGEPTNDNQADPYIEGATTSTRLPRPTRRPARRWAGSGAPAGAATPAPSRPPRAASRISPR